MELELTDKVAVVTGASKGIGLAVTRALAEHGARVVTGSRTVTDDLARLADKYDVTPHQVDLAARRGAAELIQRAADTYGALDVLVNNVATSSPAPSFTEVDDDTWQRIFDSTFFSAVRASRAAVPHLLASGGTIVNISSGNARVPAPMIVHYSAAKAALSNLTKSLSEELAPHGVRVNTVSPGPVRTPLWTAPDDGFATMMAAGSGTTVEDIMDRVLPETMRIATGRISEPEEVADLVLFLASGRAANITGSDFVIDGGLIKSV
ncbi:MAG: SDR family oxidoreductase [Propionibacteriales bacterium]|nr:SDR family oxidoreductase [Propionibacteriales bacterium]